MDESNLAITLIKGGLKIKNMKQLKPLVQNWRMKEALYAALSLTGPPIAISLLQKYSVAPEVEQALKERGLLDFSLQRMCRAVILEFGGNSRKVVDAIAPRRIPKILRDYLREMTNEYASESYLEYEKEKKSVEENWIVVNENA